MRCALSVAVLLGSVAAYAQDAGGSASGDPTAPGAASVAGRCTDDPDATVICYDSDGIAQGQSDSTTDPVGFGLRPGACAPSDATCTAANLNLFGGQDTTTIEVDDYTQCGGSTVTVTVYDRDSGSSTATVLTEASEWTAETDDSTTATNLAAAVDALTGVGATASTTTVQITLAIGTGAVTLAEDTAACTTVDTGTRGVVSVLGSIDIETNDAKILGAGVGGSGSYISSGSGQIEVRRASNGAAMVQFQESGGITRFYSEVRVQDNQDLAFGSSGDYDIDYSTIDTDLCITHSSNGEVFCIDDTSGETTIGVISGDGAGKAVCIKSDGTLGTCSDAVGGSGTCTCG